ncbi:hypothetical protein [Croceimicrobium hydrocarbonivorans]|uniref:Uncharacterized protein n=1 Tax=Croceimicrobium hydrocarbonivorans TaxID=2761580 RepID=A0A7H0VB57_9FLAO|nr:hypothetical protein [Croceimicrobium hydrocarbonivorans]QNR22955.1 hypothetical protein H4K34_11255 [Croceimicrobium hydrocarbonivorans]QNR22998.1 hypothetical protein H4K34_11470 [Croceimicrobium hydrocarbonivorans]
MDPASAQMIGQGLGSATEQLNNTNAHAYVVPNSYSQIPFYLTVVVVFAVIAVVGFALFRKK